VALEVGLAHQLTITQVKPVPSAEPAAAVAADEAGEVVDLPPGPHHQLRGGDGQTAGGAAAAGAKHPEVIAAAEDEVGPVVEPAALLAEPAVAGRTPETGLVPELVDRPQ